MTGRRLHHIGRLQIAPAFDSCLISILGVALEIFLGELSGGRALPSELLANEGIFGHALLKREFSQQGRLAVGSDQCTPFERQYILPCTRLERA